MSSHLAFSVRRSDLISRILIPKYYDPELSDGLELARDQFDLVSLESLLADGQAGSRLGDWVRREHYGTGPIPYVRTSDLSHWRIRPDFKKGVSAAIYEEYRHRQDVQGNDILMVAHGTYLVGAVAIVTENEKRLVLQDHVFRLRVREDAPITPHYLLAALSSAFCKRQIRARQFSADIIDKIGERHLQIQIPIPKNIETVKLVDTIVNDIVVEQDRTRAEIASICGSDMRMVRERSTARFSFSVRKSDIRGTVLLPKYYDPILENDLKAAQERDSEPWISIGELVGQGLLSASTGVEVGKLAYGTGDIPFLRTSDIADLEVKRDPKQGISAAIYDEYSTQASVASEDILLVRDGTYLVGSSAIVGTDGAPALICGGLYRLRVLERNQLDPFTILALLNNPLSRRQMRARQFTRDVIDTLGHRLLEILIPSPFSALSLSNGAKLADVMSSKTALKNSIRSAIQAIEPPVTKALQGRPGWSMRG